MSTNLKRRSLASLSARAGTIAIVAALMPLGVQVGDHGVSVGAPEAHAGPGGNGGGNGGGQAGGNGGGHGGGNGGGQAGGQAGGGGVGAASAHGGAHGPQDNHGAIASALGPANAAHASPTALENAAPNSQVGKMAAYRDAALASEEAAEAEADFDSAISTAVDLTGIAVDDETTIGEVVDEINSVLDDEHNGLTEAQESELEAAKSELETFGDTAAISDVEESLADETAIAEDTEETALDDTGIRDKSQPGVMEALADLLGL